MKRINEALNDCEDANHLSFLYGSIHDFSEFMNLEKESIKSRDVFGDKLYDFDVYPGFEQDHGNPFSDYIYSLSRDLLGDLSELEQELILELTPQLGADDLPYYDLLKAQFDGICAGSKLCAQALIWGDISIKDIPSGIQTKPDEFEDWLRKETSETTQAFADVVFEI